MSDLYSRRHALMAMALTMSGGALLLAGCGGHHDDSNSSTAGTRAIPAAVTPPSGFAIPTNRLTAQTGLNAPSTVAADGTVSLPVLVPTSEQTSGNPTLAWMRSGDDMVLIGFIAPGTTTINAQSTAIALVYLALSGSSLPAASKAQFLGLIAADPALPPLVQTLENRLAVNPLALAQGDAEIGAALKTTLQAIGATGNRAMKAVRADPTRGRALDALTSITPSTPQSNVEVLQASAAQNIVATNHARRYARVYTYQTGYKDKQGNRTDYAQAKSFGSVIPLPATTALGVFSTLQNILSRETAFVPVSTPSIPLDTVADASETYYEVIVLGASSVLIDPTFFTDSKYASPVAEWRDAQEFLTLKSWFVDVFLGLVLEIWGVHSIAKNDAVIDAAVQAFRNEEIGVGFGLIELVVRGQYLNAIKLFLTNFSQSAEYAARIRALLAPWFSSIAGVSITPSEASAGAGVVLKTLLAALNAAGLVLGAGDLAAVLYDLANVDPGNYWKTTLVARTVRITPTTAEITRGQSQTFTVAIPAGSAPGASVIYLWSVTGSDLVILTDVTTGKSAKEIETASSTIILATTPSTQGTLTVSVTATVSQNGVVTTLGDAQAKVTIGEAQADTVKLAFEHNVAANGYGGTRSYFSFPIVPNAKSYDFVVNTPGDAGYTRVRILQANVGDPTSFNDISQPIPFSNEGGAFYSLYVRRDNNIYAFIGNSTWGAGTSIPTQEDMEQLLHRTYDPVYKQVTVNF